MTRRLRALNGGRFRIWWIHNREQAKQHLLFAALVALFLTASTNDYRDQIDYERAARADAETIARENKALVNTLPSVTFILEAKTEQELRERLADVAGAADYQRWRLASPKK